MRWIGRAGLGWKEWDKVRWEKEWMEMESGVCEYFEEMKERGGGGEEEREEGKRMRERKGEESAGGWVEM